MTLPRLLLFPWFCVAVFSAHLFPCFHCNSSVLSFMLRYVTSVFLVSAYVTEPLLVMQEYGSQCVYVCLVLWWSVRAWVYVLWGGVNSLFSGGTEFSSSGSLVCVGSFSWSDSVTPPQGSMVHCRLFMHIVPRALGEGLFWAFHNAIAVSLLGRGGGFL